MNMFETIENLWQQFEKLIPEMRHISKRWKAQPEVIELIGIIADSLEDINSPLVAGLRWAAQHNKHPLILGYGNTEAAWMIGGERVKLYGSSPDFLPEKVFYKILCEKQPEYMLVKIFTTARQAMEALAKVFI